MIKIRISGRGGQGGKTAADLMAAMYHSADGEKGKFPYVSATTTYGPERRGAPVDSFVRLSENEIRALGSFSDPDMVIVLDGTLADDPNVNVASGLKDGGILLINSWRAPYDYAEFCRRFRVFTVDASRIAVASGLGTETTPIVNTALMGAFARVSGLGSLEVLLQFIGDEMQKKIEANQKVASMAYDAVHGVIPSNLEEVLRGMEGDKS
ncbi:MAG TPA: 2-oxoacid:acceptor oxidoreductase family protein [Candidatus Paceibacterota bacterium]